MTCTDCGCAELNARGECLTCGMDLPSRGIVSLPRSARLEIAAKCRVCDAADEPSAGVCLDGCPHTFEFDEHFRRMATAVLAA